MIVSSYPSLKIIIYVLSIKKYKKFFKQLWENQFLHFFLMSVFPYSCNAAPKSLNCLIRGLIRVKKISVQFLISLFIVFQLTKNNQIFLNKFVVFFKNWVIKISFFWCSSFWFWSSSMILICWCLIIFICISKNSFSL